MMCLVYREKTDGGRKILQVAKEASTGCQNYPTSVLNGFCPETVVVYGFFGHYFTGHSCQPFRDVITMNAATLAERYERTMARIEKIARRIQSRRTVKVRD